MNNIEKKLEKEDVKQIDNVLDVLIDKVFKPVKKRKKAKAY